MNNTDISMLFEKKNNNPKKTRKERKLETKSRERNVQELEEYNKIKSSLIEKENKKIEIIPKKINNLERTQYKDLKKNDIEKELIKENIEIKKELITDNIQKKHPFLFLGNVFYYFILIIAFLTSIGNIIYIYLYNKTNNNLINAGLLISISFFYLFNNLFKNSKAKKLFGMFTSLSVMGIMAFNLFIA